MVLDAIATQTESLILQPAILARSLAQLTTSVGGFFATCFAMYACFEVSAWIALPLSIVAAGFLVRIFSFNMIAGTAHSSSRDERTI